eukprot:UN03098
MPKKKNNKTNSYIVYTHIQFILYLLYICNNPSLSYLKYVNSISFFTKSDNLYSCFFFLSFSPFLPNQQKQYFIFLLFSFHTHITHTLVHSFSP